MEKDLTLRSAFLSVYDKNDLAPLVKALVDQNVRLYASGGTADFIRQMDAEVIEVSELTGFPEILGGRVKTLHPAIFGAILAIRDNQKHQQDLQRHTIPTFDAVIVDLYPFAETLAETQNHPDIIEKIDVGGVSLIRAAAKNHADVVVIPSKRYFSDFVQKITSQKAVFSYQNRRFWASEAFRVTAEYDALIESYLRLGTQADETYPLKYGENPHQSAQFSGSLDDLFIRHTDAELSYNNLLDCDAALRLINEFDHRRCTLAIIKHTNPCGVATRDTVIDAWDAAFACDPTSAYGGIIVLNQPLTLELAQRLDAFFYEVLIAPEYEPEARAMLIQKGQRKILSYRNTPLASILERTVLNGKLIQREDQTKIDGGNYNLVSEHPASVDQINDLIFGEKVVKHLKSNAIAIIKNEQLIGSGTGQTSRIEAYQQAVNKARLMGFSTQDAVMISDGFFPFPDIVRHAVEDGIQAVLQPGGSKRDHESIEVAKENGIALFLNGIRHFRH